WEYQKKIVQWTMHNEAVMYDSAMIEGRRAVILCDRPVPDSRAHLPEGVGGDLTYEALLGECGTDCQSILESYQAVMKLTTAADGAPEFYALASNVARNKTPEQAVRLDGRIEEAYHRHPHLRVIDNSTDFEEKKRRVLREVCHVLGIPAPLETEAKYQINLPQ